LDPEGNPATGLKLRVDGLSKMLIRGDNEGTFPLWIYPPELPGDLWQAETDDKGVAVLGKLPRGSRVHLTHDQSDWADFPGHHNILITDLMVGGEQKTLRAQPASSLQGRVSLPDGSPARGVEVQLRNFMPYTTAHGDAVMTNENGIYRFDRIPAAGYNLYLHVEGDLYGKWVSSEKEHGVRIEEGQSVEGVDFVLTKGLTVTGRKIDSVTGEEVAPPITWVLPEGTHKIYYSAAVPEGYHTSREEFEVTVGPDEGLEVDLLFIPLGEADAFFGVVVNEDGQPVPGAEIICSLDGPPYQKMTETDETGRFEVKLWPGQQYSRLFATKGNSATPEKVKCEAGKESRIVITASNFPRVRGRVVDEAGDPIMGAKISWNTEKIPGMPKELFTNEAGKYVIERITANSHAGIFASASGYGQRMDQVELKLGDDLELEDLVLLTAQSKVAGRIIDPQGNPVAHAKVFAEGYLQPPRGVVGESDALGLFELSGLVDRWFWITASVPTSDSTSRRYKTRAKAGMTDVVLTLPDQATESLWPEMIDYVGKPAPPLKADSWINSPPLNERASGKVRMVKFVAMDRSLIFFSRVLPAFQEFRNAHQNEDLEIILIYGPWPPQEARELLAENYPNVTLPIAIESRESPMSEALGVRSWQTLVIDRDNIVRFQDTGNWSQAKEIALKLLGKEE
ncbi:MAG: carboxypeptidase-like regulatory domain-containing protein, partial [Verrucomicrobiota bacterium]